MTAVFAVPAVPAVFAVPVVLAGAGGATERDVRAREVRARDEELIA